MSIHYLAWDNFYWDLFLYFDWQSKSTLGNNINLPEIVPLIDVMNTSDLFCSAKYSTELTHEVCDSFMIVVTKLLPHICCDAYREDFVRRYIMLLWGGLEYGMNRGMKYFTLHLFLVRKSGVRNLNHCLSNSVWNINQGFLIFFSYNRLCSAPSMPFPLFCHLVSSHNTAWLLLLSIPTTKWTSILWLLPLSRWLQIHYFSIDMAVLLQRWWGKREMLPRQMDNFRC